MNDQNASPSPPEKTPNLQPRLLSKTPAASESEKEESRIRESRRRHASHERQSGEDRSNGQRGRKHLSKQKSKLTTIQKMEKYTMFGSMVLGALVIFAGGFYIGQKSGHHSETASQIVRQEAELPLQETDELLDVAFTALGNGKYRDAFLTFQKAQDKQSALVGLDYLIAATAFKSGENSLAREAAGRAILKNESADQAHTLLSLIDLDKSGAQDQQMVDPKAAAETALKQLIANRVWDAGAYSLWGDFLRSNGSYVDAAAAFHKGMLRADPELSAELLAAKEKLSLLQKEPAKDVPSLSELTSMTADQALVAAVTALQQHQTESAVSFLERAQELYSPKVFQKLMSDKFFDEFRSDVHLAQFFTTNAT